MTSLMQSQQQQNNTTMLSYLHSREGILIIASAIQSLTKGNQENKVMIDIEADCFTSITKLINFAKRNQYSPRYLSNSSQTLSN